MGSARRVAADRSPEVIVRFAWAVCGIALIAPLTACTSDDDGGSPASSAAAPASAPAWHEPVSYAYVVDRRCGTGPSLGTYRVTVRGSEVAEVERTDGKTASGEEEIELPTLGGLLELARTAAEDGGEMTTSVDPEDGHPVAISFDVSEGSGEGPTCFVISAYTALK